MRDNRKLDQKKQFYYLLHSIIFISVESKTFENTRRRRRSPKVNRRLNRTCQKENVRHSKDKAIKADSGSRPIPMSRFPPFYEFAFHTSIRPISHSTDLFNRKKFQTFLFPKVRPTREGFETEKVHFPSNRIAIIV